jgi:hypothetical protein
MAVIENAKLNGAELVRELAKTGTADAKLALPRQVLAFVHRREKRIASAAEVIDAMEWAGVKAEYLDHPPTPELTLRKARALALTGVWEGPTEKPEPTVEDRILAGAGVPEPPEPPAADRAVSAGPPEPETLAEALAAKPAAKPAAKKVVAKTRAAETPAA